MKERMNVESNQERLDAIQEQLLKAKDHKDYPLAASLLEYMNSDYSNRGANKLKLYDSFDQAYHCPIRKLDEPDTFWSGPLSSALHLLFGKERGEELLDVLQRRMTYSYSRMSYYRKGYRSRKLSYYFEALIDLIHVYYGSIAYEYSVVDYVTIQDKQLHDDHMMSHLIAREIDSGNTVVIEALREIMFGDNQSALLTREMIRGVVMSHNVECYEMLAQLLLAAKLQEGLRQQIVESIDEGTLEASIYLIQVILDNNLERFSSVIRALDTWTGLGFSDEKPAVARKCLEQALRSLTDNDYRSEAEHSGDTLVYYFSLWAAAAIEVEDALAMIRHTLKSGARYKKLAALYFLSQIDDQRAKHEVVEEHLVAAVDDLEIAGWMINSYYYDSGVGYGYNWENSLRQFDLTNTCINADAAARREQFMVLLSILRQLKGAEQSFAESVFPWQCISLSADDVIRRMMTLCVYDRNAALIDLLIDCYDRMGSDLRFGFIVNLITQPEEGKQRQFMLTALNDKSAGNREAALKMMKKLELTSIELEKVTALLKLKTGSVRQTGIQLLVEQSEEELGAFLPPLLSSSNVQQRLAGLEITDQLKRDAARVKLYESALALVERFNASGRATSQEQVLIDKLLSKGEASFSRENGFGLFDPSDEVLISAQFDHPAFGGAAAEAECYSPQETESIVQYDQERIIAVYRYFDALIEEHRDHEYETEYYSGHIEKVLLGNQRYSLGKVYCKQEEGREQDRLDHYPLPDVWRQAANELALTPELMLQMLFANSSPYGRTDNDQEWFKALYADLLDAENNKLLQKELDLMKHASLTIQLIGLLLHETEVQAVFRICMGVYRSLRSRLSVEQCAQSRLLVRENMYYSNSYEPALSSAALHFWLGRAKMLVVVGDDTMFREWFFTAFASYKLMKYEDGALLSAELFARATELGLMKESQLLREMLMGYSAEQMIRTLTHASWGKEVLDPYPWVGNMVANAVERIVEVESRRGDMPTEVSKLAKNIQRHEGMRYFIALLVGLGKETFQRGYSYGSNLLKKDVLSSLLQCCHPAKGEDAALLAQLLADTDIKEQRLLEAAMYAPQWVDIVQQYLGWPGLKSAAWYFHAHINAAFSAQKETEVAIYSPISPQSFNDGAFDSEWFKSAYAQLGEERFTMLYNCAKYITDGGNTHRRAQLFADAALGKLDKQVLVEEIKAARNKDKLLCYTLLPIGRGDKREALERYEFIQRFLKESKQFGAQRRESEGKACAIALDNLARSSGYGDVNRMMWELEAEKISELEIYFRPQEMNGINVWLDIDEEGQIAIKVEKAGKALKSVPSAINKHERVLLLKETQQSLKDQHARAKRSFEQAMENGTAFTAKELALITRNPVVAPLVHHLVWCCEDMGDQAIGYLHEANDEFSLRKPDGSLLALSAEANLRLAHPVHLYPSGLWSEFQRDLFERKLKQPFKQVFREYYRLDPDEKAAGIASRRYAGHQIGPKRALALLRGRLWTVDYEEGLQKVYYKENLIARMYAMADWFSPSDIEPPTLETVQFFDRETMEPVQLEQVPPIIFSEVMRDIDLVVSVAHVGGVDPEASHSTVEMRSAIARELLVLLKVNNVRIEGSHAHIEGQLGNYSVHMGSGVVHNKGAGALYILPVHSQSRGRLFLPFADSDPRTAEIMSKLLLLAEVQKLKDPSILARLT